LQTLVNSIERELYPRELEGKLQQTGVRLPPSLALPPEVERELTAREREVLALSCNRLTSKEIAESMLVAPVAYATSLGDSNFSFLDIELQQQKEAEQLLPWDEAIKKFNENKAIADQQKRGVDQKALEQIIQGAKTLPGSAQNPPVPQSKDIGSVTPAAVVKTWYYWFISGA
jgi:hypothetical protein